MDFTRRTPGPALLLGLIGTALFAFNQLAEAQRSPPTEHRGVGVTRLGVIAESSLSSQLGLDGHIMQLREITLAPGGRIARHDHAKRPGIVWMRSGAWIEGRADAERVYAESTEEALLEDERTVHWFFNDGSEPATAYVCDIVPAP